MKTSVVMTGLALMVTVLSAAAEDAAVRGSEQATVPAAVVTPVGVQNPSPSFEGMFTDMPIQEDAVRFIAAELNDAMQSNVETLRRDLPSGL